MKNYFYAVIAAALIFTSCGKDNDEPLPENISLQEAFYRNEEEIKSSLEILYENVCTYVSGQNELDSLRFDGGQITSKNQIVSKTWRSGFVFNNNALIIIALENKRISYSPALYLRDAYALRAFVLYNMAMSWNRIPLINTLYTTDDDIIDCNLVYSDADTVYNYCLGLIEKAQTYEVDERTENTNYYVSAKFISILKAEILMAQNDYEAANGILQNIPTEDVFMFAGSDEAGIDQIDIYTSSYIECLKEEATGIENSKAWYERRDQYGSFTALRRLGKVQDYTDIPEYMNILPLQNLEAFRKNTQNPGY